MTTPPLVRTLIIGAALGLLSVAVVAVVAHWGTTAPLIPVVAIVTGAWYGGRRIGFVTTAVATALMPVALPPIGSYHLANPHDAVRIALLPLVGIWATLIVAHMRDTAQTLDATLDSIGDGVIVTDASGRVVRLNRSAEMLTGWSAGEALGRPIGQVMPLVDETTRAPLENALSRALSAGPGNSLVNHTVLVRRDGTERAVDHTASSTRDQSGRLTGAVLVCRDVTARRRAEREALVNERRFRALVEASAQVFWKTDAAGRITSDVAGWQDFTGFPSETVVGSGWADAVHPEDARRVAREWDAAVRAANTRQSAPGDVTASAARTLPYSAEFRLRNGAGDWRWVQARAVPLRAPDGTIIEWVGMTTDITEQRRAGDALRESEERFRTLADTVPVLMWMTGPTGTEFVNREFVRFTGLTLDRLLRMGWTDVVHPEDARSYVMAYISAMERRERFEAQFRCRRSDGEYRWLKSVGVPRLGADGVLIGYVGVSVDVTDLKQAEEVLQYASRTKDQFLATVSHELRTPLNAILGWTMMLRSPTGPGRLAHGLETIERNAKALARIIEDLLDFSRTTRGELRVDRAPLDLCPIVETAIDLIHVMADEKGVALELEQCETGIVMGDTLRLQQVVTNLLTNAIKFTPPGGRVGVRLVQLGKEVVLTVKDSGVGIPRDQLEDVFDPFRQLDAHGTMGLGLGLSIVRHIVAAHEGTAQAESEGEGRGATFTVRLPAAIDEGTEQSDGAA